MNIIIIAVVVQDDAPHALPSVLPVGASRSAFLFSIMLIVLHL
jgi:hypothetical protein